MLQFQVQSLYNIFIEEISIHAVQIEYVVAHDTENLVRATYLQAIKRGVMHAEDILVLGDGTSWIWKRVAAMFPKRATTEIMDFYHVSKYLWKAVTATWGTENAQTSTWTEQQCQP